MATGVSILCYKSKTLANGAHPLMIRLCKDGKKKYVSLGVAVLPQFWDFEKNKPKRNCPNKIVIDKLIASATGDGQVYGFKASGGGDVAATAVVRTNVEVIVRGADNGINGLVRKSFGDGGELPGFR